MAVATETTTAGAPTRHRFTVDEWDELGRLDFFHEEAIPEYWIVDLGNEVVLVFTGPGPEGYRTSSTARTGDTLAPRALPQVTFAVAEVLAPGAPGAH
ncbi:MAG TPA: Uma2 family endonuclease [Acidimicrobiales bacterium]|jgi:Uma2 family endonuclease|nr:Uma2 family endonuclease [Acidimicrobiales bacterium]